MVEMALKNIKVVSLDLDGTIVSKNFADYFWLELVPELYAREHGLSIEEAKSVVLSMYDEVGPDDIRWYLPDYWFTKFKLSKPYTQVLESIKHKVEVFQDAVETINKLCGKYDLIITTNASKVFIDVELQVININCFKKIFSCVSDYNLPRKTKEFYLSICKELSISPCEMLHVGDDEKYDYQVPRDIGINAFLIDRFGKKVSLPHTLRSLTQLISLL
ncbi:MAG: hypothetical protein DRJ31_01590 [Candidatus Methanomethylicota archaeon]|uniref:HAD family hydrolase n=1 Tax=Thermoproteota archaeon TaxID=2056631 RepID=A0A497F268_9CREN|nr:MAG: hypothetical protein DRJ31_01590 [Candidatus Verstraetearchaeota archaeon]RLE53595.1 MAG: hypothetical protein DRJ33_00630 [Candidatus Verstraetearchaeota archaeon]